MINISIHSASDLKAEKMAVSRELWITRFRAFAEQSIEAAAWFSEASLSTWQPLRGLHFSAINSPKCNKNCSAHSKPRAFYFYWGWLLFTSVNKFRANMIFPSAWCYIICCGIRSFVYATHPRSLLLVVHSRSLHSLPRALTSTARATHSDRYTPTLETHLLTHTPRHTSFPPWDPIPNSNNSQPFSHQSVKCSRRHVRKKRLRNNGRIRNPLEHAPLARAWVRARPHCSRWQHTPRAHGKRDACVRSRDRRRAPIHAK